jgi:hypothetical protein
MPSAAPTKNQVICNYAFSKIVASSPTIQWPGLHWRAFQGRLSLAISGEFSELDAMSASPFSSDAVKSARIAFDHCVEAKL